ncbi:ankyrin repeat domain-containing protein [Candidatus Chromulinivorax destructor]|uniref:Uncharacterized protein n=1 Tax=Candidatus Chromulinivorax destructor TaxID=2066483 RepID=A0A345ZCU8_9BACT|nr:ankyrin repeat domain-containing protein [Candidatus Chromulinivorax destructor]AXK61115.1 hypothetical protein C0J27_05280 [Candidatus Chromulinivorax destructor]
MNIFKKTVLFCTFIISPCLYSSADTDSETVPLLGDNPRAVVMKATELGDNPRVVIMKATDFPVLQEGFELCGRYNLQQFLDQKVEEFMANNVSHDEGNDAGEYAFDTLAHAIIPAQDLIVSILSKDTACLQKFCTILDEILENDLDLNSNPGFFACKKLHLSDNYSDDAIVECCDFYCVLTPCVRNIRYLCVFEKFSHHATDPFFQYCIQVSFMNPVITHYVRTYKDKNNRGLLEKTIIKNNSQIMQFLIDKVIDIKKTKFHPRGWTQSTVFTPFEFAIKSSAHKIIPILAVAQEHDLVQEKLWNFVELNNSVMMQALIDAGVDVNAVNQKGETPLHCAARNQYNTLIPVLIAAGANLYAQNKDGKIAWDVAAEKNKDPLKLQHTRDLLQPPAALTHTDNSWRIF